MTFPRPTRVLFALSGTGALAVAITGALLLWSYREATLAASAERHALIVAARAHALGDEVAALVHEIDRLSHLAEVDLADGNLEPEKTVLRLARRDSAVFSISIALLDSHGVVLWAEPRDSRPAGPGATLLSLLRDSGRPIVRYSDGEIDVAAPVPGQGAIVGIVEGHRGRDVFGPELRRALRQRGEIALVIPGRDSPEIVVAAARAGPPLPSLPLAASGQAWTVDPSGSRWLVTAAAVPDTPVVLRLLLPASEVEGDLAGPFKRLVALVVALLALAVCGGLALAIYARRLERSEVELARSRELAAIGNTAAAIAHEVKNSLNGISVALDLLASRRASPSSAAEVHAQARHEISRLRGVADDLTLFAAPPRLELGHAELQDLCRRAASSCAALALDCGVELELDLGAAEATLFVSGDAHKLVSALQNVVRNGIEAMGPGAFGEPLGSPARQHERRLVVSLRHVGSQAVVEVADRGPGIAPAVRAKLFAPFVTTKRTGTGLGLAIARRVVEAHGGRIEATDRAGGGTVFRMTLPAAPATAMASTQRAAASEDDAARQASNAT